MGRCVCEHRVRVRFRASIVACTWRDAQAAVIFGMHSALQDGLTARIRVKKGCGEDSVSRVSLTELCKEARSSHEMFPVRGMGWNKG